MYCKIVVLDTKKEAVYLSIIFLPPLQEIVTSPISVYGHLFHGGDPMVPDPKKDYKDNLVDRSIVPSYMFNGQIPRYISGSGYILPRLTFQCLFEQGIMTITLPVPLGSNSFIAFIRRTEHHSFVWVDWVHKYQLVQEFDLMANILKTIKKILDLANIADSSVVLVNFLNGRVW